MTTHPLRLPRRGRELRVVPGVGRRRPAVAPWMIMALIGVVAFLGLGFAQTSLDRSAFELSELNRLIEAEEDLNHRLSIEVAALENPARIADLAKEMGLVIPRDRRQLLVDGVIRDGTAVVVHNSTGGE